MSNILSHRRLPRYINVHKSVFNDVEVIASLAVSEFSQLCELLTDTSGEVTINLLVTVDRRLTGTARANLDLLCQRCLTPFNFAVECQLKFILVNTEEQAECLPETWEPWLIDQGRINLYQLIEHEILLCLPLIARHQDDCVSPEVFSWGDNLGSTEFLEKVSQEKIQSNMLEEEENQMYNCKPFDVLRNFKDHLK